MMVPDQLLRSFLVQHRATLTIILFLFSAFISLRVLFIEKGEVTFSVAPLKRIKSLLDPISANNGALYYR